MEDWILEEPDGNGYGCLSCGKALLGRMGKKFCCDQCRASYHNLHKAKEEKWILRLNQILRNNRKILKSLNPAGMATVRQEVLQEMGFDARFFTHQFKTDKGFIYYFCYEWAFQPLEGGKVLIVKWQNYMQPVNPLH